MVMLGALSSTSLSGLSLIICISLSVMCKSTNGFCIRPSASYSRSTTSIRNHNKVCWAVPNNNNHEIIGNKDPDAVVREEEDGLIMNRRRSMMIGLSSLILPVATAASTTATMMVPSVAMAETEGGEEVVTNKIFINLKGLSSPGSSEEDRIVIGLYGKAAPKSVAVLMAISDEEHGGYLTPCKPKDESRTLQKDQLEANKVYNACIESVESNSKKGVTYDLSTVWRVIPNERIDVGAVQGKFISRMPPNFQDENTLKHDAPGVVSVRRGDDGGFGFTIYPGNGDNKTLDESHIVVGRVLEGMDVVQKLNQVPVVKSANAASAFTGGPRAAPSRACRYGSSELFCNEYKPLKKLLITKTGIIS